MEVSSTVSDELNEHPTGVSESCTGDGKAPLYQRLETSEIRLLGIIHGDHDTLVCRLDTYHQQETPEFDALSYC